MNDGVEIDEKNDEKLVLSKSWLKVSKSLHNEGYREGSSSGRDLTFQQAFDSGYNDGFQTGFELGIHKGIMRILSSELSFVDKTLKNVLPNIELPPQEDLCAICTENMKTSDSNDGPSTSKNNAPIINMSELKNLQVQLNKEKLQDLFTDEYTSFLNDTKLNKLFNKK